eukprot:CAMPEP_0203759576 /NCGR_PEP_ID=MMETSP0098-20131031/12627_1 /ASSEMBLY_ACC=CAM_ASM_000208 /TAXON_ID=96639 /ORGANISM=" , Strain NY0313808BC1" /LENGTH=1496 /DNA_ID=CAMNT_0050652605 /DNA_START=1368 /DNA_END=5855 /DNA_ORIENTATION=+
MVASGTFLALAWLGITLHRAIAHHHLEESALLHRFLDGGAWDEEFDIERTLIARKENMLKLASVSSVLAIQESRKLAQKRRLVEGRIPRELRKLYVEEEVLLENVRIFPVTERGDNFTKVWTRTEVNGTEVFFRFHSSNLRHDSASFRVLQGYKFAGETYDDVLFEGDDDFSSVYFPVPPNEVVKYAPAEYVGKKMGYQGRVNYLCVRVSFSDTGSMLSLDAFKTRMQETRDFFWEQSFRTYEINLSFMDYKFQVPRQMIKELDENPSFWQRLDYMYDLINNDDRFPYTDVRNEFVHIYFVVDPEYFPEGGAAGAWGIGVTQTGDSDEHRSVQTSTFVHETMHMLGLRHQNQRGMEYADIAPEINAAYRVELGWFPDDFVVEIDEYTDGGERTFNLIASDTLIASQAEKVESDESKIAVRVWRHSQTSVAIPDAELLLPLVVSVIQGYGVVIHEVIRSKTKHAISKFDPEKEFKSRLHAIGQTNILDGAPHGEVGVSEYDDGYRGGFHVALPVGGSMSFEDTGVTCYVENTGHSTITIDEVAFDVYTVKVRLISEELEHQTPVQAILKPNTVLSTLTNEELAPFPQGCESLADNGKYSPVVGSYITCDEGIPLLHGQQCKIKCRPGFSETNPGTFLTCIDGVISQVGTGSQYCEPTVPSSSVPLGDTIIVIWSFPSVAYRYFRRIRDDIFTGQNSGVIYPNDDKTVWYLDDDLDPLNGVQRKCTLDGPLGHPGLIGSMNCWNPDGPIVYPSYVELTEESCPLLRVQFPYQSFGVRGYGNLEGIYKKHQSSDYLMEYRNVLFNGSKLIAEESGKTKIEGDASGCRSWWNTEFESQRIVSHPAQIVVWDLLVWSRDGWEAGPVPILSCPMSCGTFPLDALIPNSHAVCNTSKNFVAGEGCEIVCNQGYSLFSLDFGEIGPNGHRPILCGGNGEWVKKPNDLVCVSKANNFVGLFQLERPTKRGSISKVAVTVCNKDQQGDAPIALVFDGYPYELQLQEGVPFNRAIYQKSSFSMPREERLRGNLRAGNCMYIEVLLHYLDPNTEYYIAIYSATSQYKLGDFQVGFASEELTGSTEMFPAIMINGSTNGLYFADKGLTKNRPLFHSGYPPMTHEWAYMHGEIYSDFLFATTDDWRFASYIRSSSPFLSSQLAKEWHPMSARMLNQWDETQVFFKGLHRCGLLPMPKNGKHTCGSRFPVFSGDVCEFDCDWGYTLKGPTEISCNANGEYSTIERPNCEPTTFCTAFRIADWIQEQEHFLGLYGVFRDDLQEVANGTVVFQLDYLYLYQHRDPTYPEGQAIKNRSRLLWAIHNTLFDMQGYGSPGAHPVESVWWVLNNGKGSLVRTTQPKLECVSFSKPLILSVAGLPTEKENANGIYAIEHSNKFHILLRHISFPDAVIYHRRESVTAPYKTDWCLDNDLDFGNGCYFAKAENTPHPNPANITSPYKWSLENIEIRDISCRENEYLYNEKSCVPCASCPTGYNREGCGMLNPGQCIRHKW